MSGMERNEEATESASPEKKIHNMRVSSGDKGKDEASLWIKENFGFSRRDESAVVNPIVTYNDAVAPSSPYLPRPDDQRRSNAVLKFDYDDIAMDGSSSEEEELPDIDALQLSSTIRHNSFSALSLHSTSSESSESSDEEIESQFCATPEQTTVSVESMMEQESMSIEDSVWCDLLLSLIGVPYMEDLEPGPNRTNLYSELQRDPYTFWLENKGVKRFRDWLCMMNRANLCLWMESIAITTQVVSPDESKTLFVLVAGIRAEAAANSTTPGREAATARAANLADQEMKEMLMSTLRQKVICRRRDNYSHMTTE